MLLPFNEVEFKSLLIGIRLIFVDCFTKTHIFVMHQFIPRIPCSVKLISTNVYSLCAVSV